MSYCLCLLGPQCKLESDSLTRGLRGQLYHQHCVCGDWLSCVNIFSNTLINLLCQYSLIRVWLLRFTPRYTGGVSEGEASHRTGQQQRTQITSGSFGGSATVVLGCIYQSLCLARKQFYLCIADKELSWMFRATVICGWAEKRWNDAVWKYLVLVQDCYLLRNGK